MYSSAINDDGYEHILRVYVDKNSGGIRMQASVLKGPRKKMPVWTAFITYLVASPAWVLRTVSAPKVIELRELQRYVFTDDYTPQISARGGCELRFLQSKGMTNSFALARLSDRGVRTRFSFVIFQGFFVHSSSLGFLLSSKLHLFYYGSESHIPTLSSSLFFHLHYFYSHYSLSRQGQ